MLFVPSRRLLHAHAQPQVLAGPQQSPGDITLSPAPVLTRLVRTTFKMFPRVVLRLALHALTKSPDRAMVAAVLWLFKNELLKAKDACAEDDDDEVGYWLV